MGEVEWSENRNEEQGYLKDTYLISRLNGEKNEEENVATSWEGYGWCSVLWEIQVLDTSVSACPKLDSSFFFIPLTDLLFL